MMLDPEEPEGGKTKREKPGFSGYLAPAPARETVNPVLPLMTTRGASTLRTLSRP